VDAFHRGSTPLATIDQFLKKREEEGSFQEHPLSSYKAVRHADLIRLVLLSYLEGGLGNIPKPSVLFDEIYSSILRISQDSSLLRSLYGSQHVPQISRSALLSQLKQMVQKGEVIKYGKGYRLNPTHADSVFLDLESDPS
jgi:hypothetical protein